MNQTQLQQAWKLAECKLEGKNAQTHWRALRRSKSPTAQGSCLTVVELKPKTGRYNQLRRQLAWLFHCPIVGDSIYGSEMNESKRRSRGLMLCSNGIALRHPTQTNASGEPNYIRASIEVPSKFEKYLALEEKSFAMSLHLTEKKGS